MSDDRIVDKVRKLLALARSSNQAEAEAAMAKATELITVHNLSLQEIQASGGEDWTQRESKVKANCDPEARFIGPILHRFFQVALIMRRWAHEDRGRDWPCHQIVLVGKPHNVEVAVYVYDYLRRTYRRLFKMATDAGLFVFTPRARIAFYHGLTSGLFDKLDAARRQVEEMMALVLVDDGHVEAARGMVQNLDPRKTRKDRIEVDAFLLGRAAAAQVDIRPARPTRPAKQVTA